MDGRAYIPPHSTRGGRRGYDLPRGGNQRNVNTGRDNNTQQNRRGGKQQSQPNVTRTPQQQPTPPPGQQANPTPKPVEPRAQNGPPQVEQDLPAYNFNKAEVQSMLEQGIDKSIPVYKFKASADAPKGGNPWAAKRRSTVDPTARILY